ncbi:MAG: hypothetical protein LBK02_08940, partial [Treponema sp.]|nr:hypothetical protein [Treponema sp.]
YYKRYLAKDLFYFKIFEVSSFGRENYGRALSVCPVGFSLFESGMYQMEYNIEFVKTYKGMSEEMRQSYIESATAQLEGMRKSAAENENAAEEGYLYLSLEDFLARPDLKIED